MESKPEKNEAPVHKITIGKAKEPKRILTEKEKEFVELISRAIVNNTLNGRKE